MTAHTLSFWVGLVGLVGPVLFGAWRICRVEPSGALDTPAILLAFWFALCTYLMVRG